MKKILCALGATLAMASALAWPDKPVKLEVPFPPGGSTDSIARILSTKLPEKLGGSFIVENKPGAGGTLATAFVKRAPADGYTLLVTSLGPLVIGPHLLNNVGYDALHDFDYISVAVQAPNVLVVPENSPYHKVADIIAYEKANPGKLTFASSGNGSSDHLTAELFWQVSGTSGLHVPYKGGAPAITDLLGGQVSASFQNINAVFNYIKAGKLKALAITSAKRSPLLPDVPTMEEAGVKGVVVNSWQAVVAPKGLAADIKTKLAAAIAAGLNDPQVKQKLTEVGFEIVANTPEQFSAFQATEYARWKKVIEVGNIKAD